MTLFDRLFGRRPPTPPRRGDRPRAYDTTAVGADVFDPALRHYLHGLRKGDPSFVDETSRSRWSRAREAAMLALLSRIARSDLADRLVLRGGLTMRAWFGARARDPKDADFVVLPTSLGAEDPAARAMLDRVAELAATLAEVPLEDGVHVSLQPDAITRDSIWTYERAEGRRIVVPFAVRGGSELPRGALQLDFVFGEKLRWPAIPLALEGPRTSTYRDHDRGFSVLAATMHESLAWKILWLVSDISPQGKDLYDAVLLAESLAATDDTEQLRALIDLVVNAAEVPGGVDGPWPDALREALRGVRYEWRHFVADYPYFADLEPTALGERLLVALGLGNAEGEQRG